MRAAEGFSMTGSCGNPSFVPLEGFDERAPSPQTSQMESESERASESIQCHTKAFGPGHVQLILGLVFERFGTHGTCFCGRFEACQGALTGTCSFVGLGKTAAAKTIQNTLFIYASGLRMIYKTALQELYMSRFRLTGSFQLCLAWPCDVVASQHF